MVMPDNLFLPEWAVTILLAFLGPSRACQKCSLTVALRRHGRARVRIQSWFKSSGRLNCAVSPPEGGMRSG